MKRFLCVWFYFLIHTSLFYGQNNSIINSGDTLLFTPDFFNQEEPLYIELSFDINGFKKEKSKEEYLPAILKYYILDTIEIQKDVRIKARGESRQRHCHFPPYWLNIKQSNIYKQYIEETKKVKIVSLCRDNKEYERYLLKEYIIYKMFNVLTENSFRVRLLKIKYTDTGKNNKSTNEWAFMIEPEELMASRINTLPIKFDNLNYRHTDSTATDIMSFFQYMIGNTDFTVNGRHNMKLVKSKDFTKPYLIPVPYDFDFSGLVYTDYANPAEILDIESVSERYYLGMCRSDNQYETIMEIFRDKKNQLYDLILEFEYFDKRTRKELLKYINEFYDEMGDPKFIEKKIKSTCRR